MFCALIKQGKDLKAVSKFIGTRTLLQCQKRVFQIVGGNLNPTK